MASLQTHVLVDDEWVTRTVTAEELIGMASHSRTKSAVPSSPKVPKCGILTKTAIESPVIRWVFPAQLRSFRYNDVALVGDQFVQISELGPDGQLKSVTRKVYTCSKLRKCQVIGAHDYLRKRNQDVKASRHQTSDDVSTSLLGDMELFQQVLVLVLSNGQLEFLFMSENRNGGWDFVSSKHHISSGKLVDPGFHMTVSPDWQYMSLACSENLFIVYQLDSIENLRRKFSEGLPIQPIRSVQARAVRGVIHKLEFLYTDSINASHVVLSTIIARSGVLRLAIYQWEDSESLQDALNDEITGIRLDVTAGLPVLIIPLTIGCQFLLITERSMRICSEVLGGSPTFADFPLAHKDATDWHYGTRPPMWIAWTRPLREESYHAATDLIYLAREDGWINLLEINDYGIESSLYMGPLECNIDSSFAALSSSHGDIIVASGNHGHGKIWILEARRDPKRIGQLLNWSPTVDMLLTKPEKLSKRPSSTEKGTSSVSASGRIFACSGRDRSGAIVELRYGIEGKIGLDLLYTSPIKRCWAVPSLDSATRGGFFMLLALPENSAVLHISQDLSEVSEKDHGEVMFDLLSTTLAVHVSRDTVIQVTTMHATIISPHGCYQHRFDMIEDQLATITDAAIADETIALSIYSHNTFKLIACRFDEARFVSHKTLDLDGEVTALSMATFSFGVCILVGISQRDSSTLAIFSIQWDEHGMQIPTSSQREPIFLTLREGKDAESMTVNAVTSITCVGNDNIVVGMRNGEVLTICPTGDRQPEHGFMVIRTNHFGMSPAYVFTGPVLATGPSSLVCNDTGIAIVKEPVESPKQGYFEQIFQVWLTDANEPHLPSPIVHSVTGLHQIPGYDSSTWAMISGPRIYITELQPCPEPVPRYLPLGGTPKAMLYSEPLDALATVVVKSGIYSLHFLDPTTGIDLSRPLKKIQNSDDGYAEVDYITYLGSSDIKISSLLKWRYERDGYSYEWFAILARSRENQGLLLVVSAEKEKEAAIGNTETPRRIRFWTMIYKKFKDALRLGATDENGLFVNFNTTIEYYVVRDKKFKCAMSYELPSPATSLEVVEGHLHALTTHHSLIVLDYKSESALTTERMIRLHTDELSRNGLDSISVSLPTAPERQQRLSLVSDPMCGVYGLWPPGKPMCTTSLQLIFQAHLGASIRKFVYGFSQPPWTRDQPRYARLRCLPSQNSILGIAIDGSVTQLSILDEDAWRLLEFIQSQLLLALEEPYPTRHDGVGDPRLYTTLIPASKGHVNGDVLQGCVENRSLAQVISNSQQLVELQGLLAPFGLVNTELENLSATDSTLLIYQYTYDLLNYYLASAI
ncbi:mono-functional DNA-alkylating methyl methanesulfonate N-term-domain-containing protein [Xylaria bambusicola]|uniref:mono-functional DNA-alkylating methyl methanesulfonate N-term-domain-containing protein n=1 Tax=Xylaria bambusicola TaxID=326684 RepID=UPI0020086B9E|nr:mono-functional DNA-alkylating methyl methanesulfonate N-term-domain-containing protein [Xylaria bambusicola]KAI0520793.1 mono-functional DNA-alkylating methyl methanesulfonate N-term-domain-containing protein [Xylaria bambusicola]